MNTKAYEEGVETFQEFGNCLECLCGRSHSLNGYGRQVCPEEFEGDCANPYSQGTKEHREWKNGYLNGQ